STLLTSRHLHSFPTRRSSDLGLAVDLPAVVQPRVERQRRRRDREHLAANGQHPVHLSDRLLEVSAFHGGHRRDQQIPDGVTAERSEEHTSELQSLAYLVCRLL